MAIDDRPAEGRHDRSLDRHGFGIYGGGAKRCRPPADRLDGESPFAETLHTDEVGVPPVIEDANKRAVVQQGDTAAMFALKSILHRPVGGNILPQLTHGVASLHRWPDRHHIVIDPGVETAYRAMRGLKVFVAFDSWEH